MMNGILALLLAAGAAAWLVSRPGPGAGGGDLQAQQVGGGETEITGPQGTLTVSDQAASWTDAASAAAAAQGVPADILLALVDQESGGAPGATGDVGEQGLTQLRQIAVDDVAQNTALGGADVGALTPEEQLEYGAAFLALQKRRVEQASGMTGWFDALRAYNCGFSGAQENRGCGSSYASDVLRKAGRGRATA